jgi:membrane protease YdiL (CAAX protease family)
LPRPDTGFGHLFDLAIAEAMTMLIAPRAGMIAHGVVFVLLLLHASLASHGFQQKFLLTLSLAPLIRVLSLAMPLIHFPLVYWYLVVGIPLFVAAFLTARQAKLSREMIGLQVRYLPWQLLIGTFGILLGFIEYLILRPQPLVADFPWQQLLVSALILLIFTGFLEELIFRGIMQATAWIPGERRNILRRGIICCVAPGISLSPGCPVCLRGSGDLRAAGAAPQWFPVRSDPGSRADQHLALPGFPFPAGATGDRHQRPTRYLALHWRHQRKSTVVTPSA